MCIPMFENSALQVNQSVFSTVSQANYVPILLLPQKCINTRDCLEVIHYRRVPQLLHSTHLTMVLDVQLSLGSMTHVLK